MADLDYAAHKAAAAAARESISVGRLVWAFAIMTRLDAGKDLCND